MKKTKVRTEFGVVGRKLVENDMVKDKVIPCRQGGKYFNEPAWATIGSEGGKVQKGLVPSNELCQGLLTFTSSPSEAYRKNFDLIRWANGS